MKAVKTIAGLAPPALALVLFVWLPLTLLFSGYAK